MKVKPDPHKRMTPPSTQNHKTLGLWVFFFICSSTFSFLLNLRLRLTLEYLTIVGKIEGENTRETNKNENKSPTHRK